MNTNFVGERGRILLAIAGMMALVACGGGGTDGKSVQSPSPTPSPTPAPTPTPAPPPPAPTPAPTTAALAVSTTIGGTINSSTPSGTTCSSSCSTSYTVGTAVTLTAAAATNYAFSGWTGACAGSALTCDVTLSADKTVGATFSPVTPVKGAPYVEYTDALSGPITGGEGNQGGYLSLFGENFGSTGLGTTTKVYIGGVEVANYRYLGPAKVNAKLGLQQITVQVGNLNLPLGAPVPVKVVVGSAASNTNNTFTPNPGRVLFVSLTGNDSTAVAGDIAHPWRHLQTSTNGGVAGIVQAGDQVVIRGGAWSDIGFDSSWFRFRYPNQDGSQPTGANGTGWIHFTAYPGAANANQIEDVHYTTPASMKGGFQGANSAYYGTTGDFISISNLHLDVNANATSDAAPINVQYSAGPWRIVNNELGPWPAAIHSLAAGVSGHGNGTTVLGNHIHDIACTGANENHGIYADSGALNWNIGFNWIHDITGGNLIQFFDNVGLAGNSYVGFPSGWTGFTGMKVFNNWMENSGKYGLNMADGIQSGGIWNNVIIGATYSGLRVNTISKNMDLTVAFNTFYDNDRLASGSGNGQVLNTWGNYSPTGSIKIYDNIFAAGPHTVSSSSFYENTGSSDAYFKFARNLWWDNGLGWDHSTVAGDLSALFVDPKFVAASAGNLSLAVGSPAMDAASQPPGLTIIQDFAGLPRLAGSASDLGAFESSN